MDIKVKNCCTLIKIEIRLNYLSFAELKNPPSYANIMYKCDALRKIF